MLAPSIAGALWNTAWSSAAAAALATGCGGALAFATERSAAFGRRWLRLGICLPLLVPPFIGAFGWLQAYGTAGLLQRLTGISAGWLVGGGGVVVLLAVQSVPLVYLPVASALAGQNALDLERAARASGAGTLTTLRTVSLPLARPSMAAGASLAFVSSASDFGIPAVVGLPGRFSTVTTEIYRSLSFSSNPESFDAAVALATLLAVAAGVALLALFRGGRQDVLASRWSSQSQASRPSVASAAVSGICWLWTCIVSAIPFAALLLVALTRAYGLAPTTENLTLAHFGQVLTRDGGQALVRSAALSATAALLVLALGLPLALLTRTGRLGRLLETLTALPFAMPGSALAIAMILGFSRWLYGTLAIIVLAYVARFLFLGTRPAIGALATLGPEPIRAGRVSGASPLEGLLTGALPAILPAALAGWLLVFLAALHELTVSSLLYTPATQTIAVVVLNAEQLGDVSATAAMGVLLTALLVLVATPLVAFSRGPRSRVRILHITSHAAKDLTTTLQGTYRRMRG